MFKTNGFTLISVCLISGLGAANCFAAVVTDVSSFYELGDVNTESLKSAADINSDGKIDASDLIMLNKKYAWN